MTPNIKLVYKLQRSNSLISDPLDLGAQQTTMPEPIELKHLIISKIVSPLHATEAPLHRIISIAPTGFTPDKMCHKRPSLIPQPGVILLNHLLIPINQPCPVTVQIERILKKHLIHPLLLLGQQQVYQCRLIVGLKCWPPLEIGRQDLAGLLPNRPLGTHGSPIIKQIQRPLTVPKQKTPSIHRNPRLLVKQQIRVSMKNQIIRIVLRHGKLKHHISKKSITIHPPNPLNLGM